MLIKSRGVDMIMIPEGLNRVLGRIVEIEAKAAKLASGQVSGLTSFPAVLGHELNESGGGASGIGVDPAFPAFNAGPNGVQMHGSVPFYPKTQQIVNGVLENLNDFKVSSSDIALRLVKTAIVPSVPSAVDPAALVYEEPTAIRLPALRTSVLQEVSPRISEIAIGPIASAQLLDGGDWSTEPISPSGPSPLPAERVGGVLATEVVRAAHILNGSGQSEFSAQLQFDGALGGILTLKVITEENFVRVLVQTDNAVLRQLLDTGAPVLRQALDANGLTLGQYDVSAGNGGRMQERFQEQVPLGRTSHSPVSTPSMIWSEAIKATNGTFNALA